MAYEATAYQADLSTILDSNITRCIFYELKQVLCLAGSELAEMIKPKQSHNN